MIGQSQTGSGSQIIFITLFFWQGLDFAVPFTSKVVQKCWAKTILLSQPSMF
jgi:hypothetical protein